MILRILVIYTKFATITRHLRFISATLVATRSVLKNWSYNGKLFFANPCCVYRLNHIIVAQLPFISA